MHTEDSVRPDELAQINDTELEKVAGGVLGTATLNVPVNLAIAVLGRSLRSTEDAVIDFAEDVVRAALEAAIPR